MTVAGVNVLALVMGAALAFGAFLFARRYGGGAALQELERANRVLERRVNELTVQNEQQAGELIALRARTDVALAIEPVLQALRTHETEAGKRSKATLTVLDLIAARLGPDGERLVPSR